MAKRYELNVTFKGATSDLVVEERVGKEYASRSFDGSKNRRNLVFNFYSYPVLAAAKKRLQRTKEIKGLKLSTEISYS